MTERNATSMVRLWNGSTNPPCLRASLTANARRARRCHACAYTRTDLLRDGASSSGRCTHPRPAHAWSGGDAELPFQRRPRSRRIRDDLAVFERQVRRVE